MVEPIELHAADLSTCGQACMLQIAPFHGKMYVAKGAYSAFSTLLAVLTMGAVLFGRDINILPDLFGIFRV